MIRSFLPPQTDFSPTRDEVHAMLLSLAPRGRAWQSDDASGARQESVFKSFWYAVAGVWHRLETALSGVLDEWSAVTTTADLDLWMADYGLPDTCLPTGDDLVGAVRAGAGVGDTDWPAVAARFGIQMSVRYLKGVDPEFPGVTATLHAVLSPGAVVSPSGQSVGTATVGTTRLGEADILRIVCVLDRMVPAHLAITYEIAA